MQNVLCVKQVTQQTRLGTHSQSDREGSCDVVERHRPRLVGQRHGRDRHLCNSASIRLLNGPNMVKVLKVARVCKSLDCNSRV